MKVPITLTPRTDSLAADAVLLYSQNAAEVLHAVEQAARSQLQAPTIHAIANGFLLKLQRTGDIPFAGALRLRALADNLFVPTGADIFPPLLAEELKVLTAQRGLVLLPGGRQLQFDPGQALPLSQFLQSPPVIRDDWRRLPEGGELADRINEITLELPQSTPDDIMEAGRDEIGEEEPRPPASSLPKRIAGKGAIAFGKGLAKLGGMLGSKTLAQMGAKLIAGGLSLAPRLSEQLFGKMEASLRNLLREFREGNIERALRRAVPLDRDGTSGGGISGGMKLPFHNLLYSLANILPSFGGGAGGGWLASGDTFYALEQEYRKQAQLAAQRGDYRRAAFIYGKLLRDYHSAAATLAQGGLHRDAAVIYEKQLKDLLAAARQYEAAGEIDRAVTLYREQGEHIRAAELLRRIGEEKMAIAEYMRAAERLLERGPGYYQAGELLLAQAKRPDLALKYYRRGWEEGRERGTGAGCAVRLAQIHTRAEDRAAVLALVDEAEKSFSGPGNDEQAGEFFNEIVRLAEQPVLAGNRDDLRDRALMLFAGKLRGADAARVGHLTARLLSNKANWPAPLVSDARFATRPQTPAAPPESPAPLPATSKFVRTRIAELSAVCQAAETGDIFLGFDNGELARYSIQTGEVAYLRKWGNPIAALAASDRGDTLVLLGGGDAPLLSSLTPEFALQPIAEFPVANATHTDTRLCPYLVTCRDQGLAIAGVWDGAVILRQALSLKLERLINSEGAVDAVLIFPPVCRHVNDLKAIILVNSNLLYCGGDGWTERYLGWRPSNAEKSHLKQPGVSMLAHGNTGLELAAVGGAGIVHWTDIRINSNNELGEVGTRSFTGKQFRAATLVRPGLIAAVAADEIVWLACSAGGLRVRQRRPAKCADAVACFAHETTRELIVVGANSACHRFPQML